MKSPRPTLALCFAHSGSFFLPLGSDSCHAHRSQELLMRGRATRIAAPVPSPPARRIPTPPRSLGRFGDSLSPNGSCSGAGGLSPPPTPSGPRVRTANFACRFRSSPFTPPQDRPASPQHWENWSSPRRPYPEPLAEISRASFSLGVSALGWTALLFPGSVWWWLWVLLVTVDLLTLSVTFPINGTKKLQSAAQREREAEERMRKGISARFGAQKFRCKKEAAACPTSFIERPPLTGIRPVQPGQGVDCALGLTELAKQTKNPAGKLQVP
ncbi:uncharacterized protein LOC144288441 [Canis aureus]